MTEMQSNVGKRFCRSFSARNRDAEVAATAGTGRERTPSSMYVEDLRNAVGKERKMRVKSHICAEKVPFSRTHFKTEGLNRGRLISELSRVTTVKFQPSEGNALLFSVPSSDKTKVVAIFDSLCYDYIIIKETGPFLRILRLLRRWGILAGALLVTGALCVYPFSVSDIVTDGECNAEISRILTESGVVRGAFLWDFDADAVEKRILSLDGISFASVTKRGTRVYVVVRNERDDAEFDTVPTSSVAASKRAVVTRAIVFSGTLLVKYGDVVDEGAELIAPYVLVGEERVVCAANGEVFGKTYTEATLFYPDTVITREYGDTKTYTRLSFFGKVPETPDSPFEEFELSVNTFRNSFLFGYGVFEYTFREVRYTEMQNTMTEEQMTAAAVSSVREKLSPDAVVTDSIVSVRRAEGGTYVKVTLEAEERIDV